MRSIKRIKFAWTSDTSGNCVDTTTYIYTGRIIGFASLPSLSGDTQPSNEFDVTLVDYDNVDVLAKLGADLSNAAATYKAEKDGLLCVVESALTLSVANAGASKCGAIVVFIQ